jgi:large-conductance mechanosensitive channel
MTAVVSPDFSSALAQQFIFTLAIGTLIGTYLSNFITMTVNVIGDPIVNKLISKKDIDDTDFTLFGMKFDIGKLLMLMINFMIMLVIVYFMFQVATKFGIQ